MMIVPDLAELLDREWNCGEGGPVLSEDGPITSVRYVPPRFDGRWGVSLYYESFWQLEVAGRWIGVRPTDPAERAALMLFADACAP